MLSGAGPFSTTESDAPFRTFWKRDGTSAPREAFVPIRNAPLEMRESRPFLSVFRGFSFAVPHVNGYCSSAEP